MAELYGTKWTSTQPDTPTDGWVVALDGLSASDVGIGLMALRDSGLDWPPSAVEFRRMCKPPKRENAAAYVWAGPALPHKLSDEQREKGREHIAEMRKKLA